ncbi:L,D-transpeptidase family protein [Psychrobacter sp. T6-1]|uniref:L,D-transpeptidase family protein n=1 Tax=Psychrobacter sp. T6-1 TaxID=3457447 RepID=UPI003FD25CEF
MSLSTNNISQPSKSKHPKIRILALFSIGLVAAGIIDLVRYDKNPFRTQGSYASTIAIPSNVAIDKVFVDKSERTMQLLDGDRVIKSYHIALGENPVGHKQQEGDERTPVGIYTLDYKNENSIAYRSIHISYPNSADKARAEALGVSAGGDIMIHGQMNGLGDLAWYNQQRNWTDGCIAVTNDEMDEIMDLITLGTTIEIVE